MIARTTLCSLLSVCLSTGAVLLPASSAASSTTAIMAARIAAPASVLGLDSEDASAGKALTQALRRAFAARGMSGGDELSFAEVKLTMGCENDDPKCLAQAGESLGLSRMIYGYLKKTGGGAFKVQVYVLDVEQGVIEAETAQPVSAADLSADRIDATATAIVSSLYPDEEDGETPSTIEDGDPDVEDDKEPVVRDKPKRDSPYVWGPYKPRPKWKWAGFGVGVGLTVVGIVGVALGAPKIAAGGSLEQELFKQADESLVDTYGDVYGPDHPMADELNPDNDVDRALGGDLCSIAEAAPEGMPDKVTNRDVATVCREARVWTGVTNASIVLVVVGAVTTITFTTLLFVHKDKPKPSAKRTKRERENKRKGKARLIHFDAAPSRGGVVLTGTGRF